MKWFAFVLASLLPVVTTGRAILGIDLGSLYMKVALVQSGAPLEIVTNLHSKRKTEQMILFDQGQRFYGADANALLARKSQMTPVSMSLMLGKDELHPTVKVCDTSTTKQCIKCFKNHERLFSLFISQPTGAVGTILPCSTGLQRDTPRP